MQESVENLNFGKKRRALSSACLFFHGIGLMGISVHYILFPSVSLEYIAEAWDISLMRESSSIYILARNLVMTSAVYLGIWGATCSLLATLASSRTKKFLACGNLLAGVLVSIFSVFHPEAFAAARCRDSVDQALDCLRTAFIWHGPLLLLDLIAIIFAEAGPKLIRISDRSSILLNAQPGDEHIHTTGGQYTIKKINSHASLIQQDVVSGTGEDTKGD
uniref:Uncharacterized protein n=1 Tax=Aureoumbra lagunensis TaxID=44058 RepID=A0A7S3NF49_9STRA|mmetsp:Transcript_13283/g.17740  ORF Transcript_13283/g.17740 Transcript_13283/m.17740 type:complete len:219 (-) Transcript_13283:179-835(-)